MLASLGMPLRTAVPVAQILIVIVVTYLTIVFGELVPKRIGMKSAERVAILVARPMQVLAKVTSPFVWLLSRSIELITRLLGIRDTESKVTEEEIKSIIQEGTEDGEVQIVEQQIVGRVFSLGDRKVGSIMTHRSEIAWIDPAMTPAEIRELVGRAPHTLYPAARSNLDRLAGVIYLKDLFTHIGEEDFDVASILRPAKFFHEETQVYTALEQLRSEQVGYGIVCDEFGVTQGIVTLHDIFEALVGSIPEEREEPGHRSPGGRQLPDRRAVPVLRFSGLLRAGGRLPEQPLQHPQRPDPRRAGAYSADGRKTEVEHLHVRDRRHGRRPHR